MGTKDWASFSKAKDCDDLNNYFEERVYKHGKYCHYTKLSNIENILNKKIYISCVNGFNDDCDKKQFGNGETQKYFYALCFSTGESENLALWYLYSGVDGKGGRIQLTSNKIKKLIENSTYELYEQDRETKNLIKPIIKLVQNENMKLQFKDVLYYQEEENKVRLKHNTMVINEFSLTEFQKFKSKNKGFLKNIIWYYEKEIRLLIELVGEAKECIKPDKNYVVVMSLPEKTDFIGFNIVLAPEISEEIYWDIVCDKKYENIRNLIKETSRLKLSDHSGQIHMDICGKCSIKNELEEEKKKCANCKEKKS